MAAQDHMVKVTQEVIASLVSNDVAALPVEDPAAAVGGEHSTKGQAFTERPPGVAPGVLQAHDAGLHALLARRAQGRWRGGGRTAAAAAGPNWGEVATGWSTA